MKRSVTPNAGAGKGVKIMLCACKHDYQDEKYGKNQRVHNPTKKGHRCTVCGTSKQ